MTAAVGALSRIVFSLAVWFVVGAPVVLAQPCTPHIVAADGTFLGTLGDRYEADSVNNPDGRYGSPYANGINNPISTYGSSVSAQSPNNLYAATPPKVIDPCSGRELGVLRQNSVIGAPAVIPSPPRGAMGRPQRGIDAGIYQRFARDPVRINTPAENARIVQELRALTLQNDLLELQLREAREAVPYWTSPVAGPFSSLPAGGGSVISPPAVPIAVANARLGIEGLTPSALLAKFGRPVETRIDWRGVRTWVYRIETRPVVVYIVNDRSTLTKP